MMIGVGAVPAGIRDREAGETDLRVPGILAAQGE